MRSLKTTLTLTLLLVLLTPALAHQTDANTANNNDYLLLVEISSKTLILYQLDRGQKIEIKRFPVATPIYPKALPLPLIGIVKKIELNPWWYPTPATRAAYLKKHGKELPTAIPPGDSRNAVGKAQLVIAYENFDLPIRIHGNNDPDSIGKSATRGCIRMFNENVLALIEIIKNHRVQVIIQ
ncbi:MAG: L,D-transpeptidase [bacterium]|nr:L,D-transpeptidase [bacterium]